MGIQGAVILNAFGVALLIFGRSESGRVSDAQIASWMIGLMTIGYSLGILFVEAFGGAS